MPSDQRNSPIPWVHSPLPGAACIKRKSVQARTRWHGTYLSEWTAERWSRSSSATWAEFMTTIDVPATSRWMTSDPSQTLVQPTGAKGYSTAHLALCTTYHTFPIQSSLACRGDFQWWVTSWDQEEAVHSAYWTACICKTRPERWEKGR